MKTKFAVAAVLFAAACGGGGSDVDAQLTRIDSRPTVDSPIIPVGCTLETNIAEPPNPDPAAGNTAVLRTQNQDAEEIILWNYVVLGTGTNADLFQFVVPFTADPNNIPPADFNQPLQLVQACTPDVDFCMVGLGDFDVNTMTEAQFFFPNTGTLTISSAGDVGGTFTVTMTASRFDEYMLVGQQYQQVDTDGDGVSDCNGTTPAFADIAIPITAPAVAPEPGTEHYGKFGKYTRH